MPLVGLVVILICLGIALTALHRTRWVEPPLIYVIDAVVAIAVILWVASFFGAFDGMRGAPHYRPSALRASAAYVLCGQRQCPEAAPSPEALATPARKTTVLGRPLRSSALRQGKSLVGSIRTERLTTSPEASTTIAGRSTTAPVARLAMANHTIRPGVGGCTAGLGGRGCFGMGGIGGGLAMARTLAALAPAAAARIG